MTVHYVNNASQGDIQFMCSRLWGEPKWGKPQVGPIFQAEGDKHYTFEKDKVTCEDCLKMIKELK